ncbi:protein-glutamate O-methyltransferase CheR [Stappia taiwanensis]|uniref:protein-glutamate O-methyltransferase n=1 Tax=Stappia taiwanensis TaxID=992267 RepID=A0A838XZV8_9HYPH|nr:protein-glutamate O-methyltransferase CheR [Stappia taiwanensis]MBA4612544.1 protein-glutamate O-methyltransferase CheR [Stappia taiwanensis]GGF06172.1 chemotaxis protein methyltransferase [Stappia taiwanensis]
MIASQFEYLQQFLKSRSGLVLSNEKQYLVESRLLPVARRHGLSSLSELVQAMQKPGATQIATDVVEAMTTNESFFFRDGTPFQLFRETMLPAMIKARADRRTIRIWCAAASTGQEPYSLAICLKEAAHKLAGIRVEIIATDLSSEVLDKARNGIYSQFEVQRGLPIQTLLKYFTQKGDLWQINADLRAMVQWRKLNLLESFAGLGTFDIVFCRNVLIYFDQPTKVDVLQRIARGIAPDGYLVLGAAETVVGLTDAFRPVPGLRGLYQTGQAGPSAATPRPRLSVAG